MPDYDAHAAMIESEMRPIVEDICVGLAREAHSLRVGFVDDHNPEKFIARLLEMAEDIPAEHEDAICQLRDLQAQLGEIGNHADDQARREDNRDRMRR